MCTRLAIVLVVTAFGLGVLPVHGRPTAYFSQRTLDEIKAKMGRYKWARDEVAAARGAADSWLREPIPFPEGPTGWYHDYFCPDHGVKLTYDRKRPREHVCPEDGKVWTGPKLDAYWVATTLNSVLGATRDAALVYALGEGEPYAELAAKSLDDFATYYQRRVSDRKPPRLMWQSLDEATYVLAAVQAYELVYDSPAMTDERRRHIEDDWLRPTAEFLETQRKTIHNIHCWYNAAICAIGLVLGAQDMVSFAVDGPGHGFRQQIEKGVMADGYWFEGSYGYHFYTLSALANLIFPALNNGIDLQPQLARVREMYLAPINMATAEWLVPPTNDSGRTGNVLAATGHYETALSLFPEEPAFAALLAEAYKTRGRSGRQALLWGPVALSEGAPLPARRSMDFSASGLAVLRMPAGQYENYVMLDYGPHGGGHGHPDKLNIIIGGLGQILAPDPGSAGYGMPLHGQWYKQTLSHNTITVDHQSQKPATGRLVLFRGEGPLQYMSATAHDAYPDVAWQRTVWLAAKGYLVVMDHLTSDTEHTFDWAYHNYGELSLPGLELQPCEPASFGEEAPYRTVTDLKRQTTGGPVEAIWALAGGKQVRLIALGRTDTTVFAGVGRGNPAKDDVPMVVLRRQGEEAGFAAVIEPGDGDTAIQDVLATENGLEVRLRDGGVGRFAMTP